MKDFEVLLSRKKSKLLNLNQNEFSFAKSKE